MPYYETLGRRDTVGKTFLTNFDTLTKEGTTFNDFDFFDSDGISKSKTGQVTKLAVLALPYFIPYVGEVYGYAMASVLAAEALSIFGKVGIDAFSDETDDSKKGDAWQFLNKIDAFGRSYGKSMTEEGKSSM